MKTPPSVKTLLKKSIPLSLLLSLGVLGAATVWAGELTLGSGSVLWLVGDSTLHPYTSRATQMEASIHLDPAPATAAKPTDWINAIQSQHVLKSFDLTIPIQGLKSKESGLDKNMYKSLKADTFPTIQFHLADYTVMTDTSNSQAFVVKANGTLLIAGVSRTVQLSGSLMPSETSLNLKGRYTLLMSDYGIKPPTLFLGSIRVKDPVMINFDLNFVALAVESLN